MEEQLTAPQANRIHIGFFGATNAGKSTLINALTDQDISLVSPVEGTTTDPVSKAMELFPLGPVMLVDTAGIDDRSELGALRIARTKQVLDKIHIAVYVISTATPLREEDMTWLSLLKAKSIPTMVVLNEISRDDATVFGADFMALHEELQSFQPHVVSYDIQREGREDMLRRLGTMKPAGVEEKTLLEGMIDPGDVVVLVCPIDGSAPKGRLILPQVQMIREILDLGGMSYVTQTDQLAQVLASLKEPPKIVITDSQAFEEVAAIVPKDIPMTSFSIIMARFKGNLKDLVAGARAIQGLRPGSKVLISEGCTHHRQCDDIGTVKIPKWLQAKGYEGLDLSWTSGGQFPEDVSPYDVIIHCGGCMLTRKEVLRRIDVSVIQGTPIVNYGVLIASLHGIMARALEPFTEELE